VLGAKQTIEVELAGKAAKAAAKVRIVPTLWDRQIAQV
jgi:hypothetical protein